jgi:SSS family solute:Na+ symporter
MENYQVMALIFILIYYAFVIGLSLYRKKVKTEKDYFLAGRSLPAWILAFSYAASWFGGASAIVSADKAFTGGWSAYFVMGGPTICSGIVLLAFAKRIRMFAPISQPEMTEARYNRAARIIQSIIIFWYMITWAASQMIGAANFVSGYFGMTYTLGLFVVVAVVWFYCMFGGFKSVVTTDMGQFIWIIVAMLIVLITVVTRSGGIGNVKHVVEMKGTENFFNVFGNGKFSIFYIISFSFAWTISDEIWQRFSAAKSVKDAKKISRGALYINIPLYFLAVIIGIFAVALFAEKPEGHIMGAIIKQYVPWYFAGIAFAGLLAAVMSTMDTALNTGALVLTEDIYHKVINPNASEKQLVTSGRIAVTIMAGCGILISLAIKDMLWVLWMASDILAAGVFWPLVLGMYGKWGTSKGAVASMLVGGAYTLWHYLIDLGVGLPYLMPNWPGRNWPFSVFWGIVVGFVVYAFVSAVTQSAEEKMKAETFMNSLAQEKS